MSDSLIDIGIYLTYILVAVGALAALIFPIMYMVKYPSEAKQTLIWVGGMIVIFLLGYVFASSEIPSSLQRACENFKVDTGEFKMIGAGLSTFYLLALIAIGALIAGEIRGFLK